MTIEILDIRIIENDLDSIRTRHADISISDGIDTYFLGVGGLPLVGDLQLILDVQEAELFAAAQAKGRTFDVFDVKERRVVKALAIAFMKENNLLRAELGLPLRNESQIREVIKAEMVE